MTPNQITEFKQLLQRCLFENYGYSASDAYKAVHDSYLNAALRDDPDYADHDSIEYWAEIIYEEYAQKTPK